MVNNYDDTIFSLATAVGRAATAMVRISGPRVNDVPELLGFARPEPKIASLRTLKHQKKKLDQSIVLFFSGPESYTGEDVMELHLHGGRAVIEGVYSALSAQEGFRFAENGEFSKRAVMNGRIDLTEAEGINDLINAETEAQRDQGLNQLEGALRLQLEKWSKDLKRFGAYIEAYIDFPDEEIPENILNDLLQGVEATNKELKEFVDDDRKGEILRSGLKVAVIGPPNVGKSSFVNWLTKRDIAITSEKAGTTRDIVEAHLDLGGYPVTVADTAGIRASEDTIEQEGIRRARGWAESADLRVLVLDPETIENANQFGDLLKSDDPVLINKADQAATTKKKMGAAYPLLTERADDVVSALADEEARFSETLNQGMELLKKELVDVSGQTLPGDVAFKLYDTYGFPVDLTADVARELNMEVDQAGFDEAMEAQRARGRAATSFSTSLGQKISIKDRVEFCGYDQLSNDASVIAIFDEQGDPLEALDGSDTGGVVVLDKTAFYAESGGQVGDSGLLRSEAASFVVVDTQISGDQYLHIGHVQHGCIRAGDTLQAAVDDPSRAQTRANHSATHLLHAALREVLGEHVQQRGSLVNADKLRFDFAHTGVIESDQLVAIEGLVNAQIRQNTTVDTQLLNYDEAVANGAMALFGEKYGDEVRVLTMGDGFSVELCGGTHVSRTGDIGLFRIVSEAGIAAGVRRVEAVTGQGALQTVQADQDLLADMSQTLKVGRLELAPRLQQVVAENRALLRQVEQLGQQLAANKSSDLGSQIKEIHGVQFLAAQVEGDNKAMMQTLDTVRGQMQQQCVIVLAAVDAGKVSMVAAVSKDLAIRASAAELMQTIAPSVGAKGGGRPDLARAGGGDNADGVSDALSAARAWAEQQLAS